MTRVKTTMILLALLAILGGCAGGRPAGNDGASAAPPAPAEVAVPAGEEEEDSLEGPPVMVAGATGGITVQEAGAPPRELRNGDTLPYGGEVEVAGGGDLTLAFAGAGTVRCKDGTKMRVLRESAGWLLYLDEGLLDISLPGLGGREFTVVTPALTAGVRGTEFSVLALPDGSVEVFVDAGSVKVDNPLTGDMQAVTGGGAVRAALGDDLRPADFRQAAARQAGAVAILTAAARPGVGLVLARIENRLGAVQQRQRQQIDKLRAARTQRLATVAAAMGGARDALTRRQIRLQQADLHRQERQLQAMRQWLTRQQGRDGLAADEYTRLAQLARRLRQLEGDAGTAAR